MTTQTEDRLSTSGNTEDLFRKMKDLERQLEFLEIEESFIKDESKNLKRELLRAKEEVKRIQSVPLVLGTFNELIDENVSSFFSFCS